MAENTVYASTSACIDDDNYDNNHGGSQPDHHDDRNENDLTEAYVHSVGGGGRACLRRSNYNANHDSLPCIFLTTVQHKRQEKRWKWLS